MQVVCLNKSKQQLTGLRLIYCVSLITYNDAVICEHRIQKQFGNKKNL